jgi:hypothetical protein
MSKLSEKLFSLVRQRQQRGGDQLPAKTVTKAVGLHGEDLTGELNYALRYVEQNPAMAWDLYKHNLNRSKLPATRLGDDEQPVLVDIKPPKLIKYAIISFGRVIQVWTTDLPRAVVEKHWPGFEVLRWDELPPSILVPKALMP